MKVYNRLPKNWHPDIWEYNPLLWVREPLQWLKYLSLGGYNRQYRLASSDETSANVLMLIFFYTGSTKVRIALTQNPNLPVHAQYASLFYAGGGIPQAMAGSGHLKVEGIGFAFMSDKNASQIRYMRALQLVKHRLPIAFLDAIISQDRDGRYTKTLREETASV